MCDNCNSHFDFDEKIPYLLPCGHSICKTCLDTQYNRYKYIRCNFDNTVHHQDKLKYSKNHYLIELMEETNQSRLKTNEMNKIASTFSFAYSKKSSLFSFKFNSLTLPLWTYWVKIVLFNWIKVEKEEGMSRFYRYVKWTFNLVIALIIHALLICYSDFIIVFVFIVLVNETLTLIKDKKNAETDPKYNTLFNERGKKCNRKWFYSFIFFCIKQIFEWFEVRLIFSTIPKVIFAVYLTT